MVIKSVVLFGVFLVVVGGVTNGFSIQEQHHEEENEVAAPKVKLGLYYESECFFCTLFIQKELAPLMPTFGKYLDVHLNPFGNAMMSEDPAHPGQYVFNCQHGPEECKGGIVESCLIDKLKAAAVERSEEAVSLQQQMVKAIACIESKPAELSNAKKCMSMYGITTPTFEEVATCSQGKEGNQIFAKLGQETASLQPAHQYTPWIVFNGAHTDEMNQEAQMGLKGALCRHFLKSVPECQ